jgi:hypothetical protein
MKLTMWLKERELNARRLAAERTGDDRAGLLQDADHFQAVLAAVEERDNLRSELAKSERRVIASGNIVQHHLGEVDALIETANALKSRVDVYEARVKAQDRLLHSMRSEFRCADSLEEKLAIMKKQRRLEIERGEMMRQLFAVMDAEKGNGENATLTPDEVRILVAPLREILSRNMELGIIPAQLEEEL